MSIRSKTLGYALLGALLTAELAASMRIALDYHAPDQAAHASEASRSRRVPLAQTSEKKNGTASFETRSSAAPGHAGAMPAAASMSVKLGAEAFRRDGTWELVRRFDGRLNGESVRSFHAGSSATLAFVGCAVRLYGVVGRGGGPATIELDGRVVRNVTFYAAQKSAHRLLFASAPLSRGVHRLKVSVLYEAAGPSKRKHYVNIEGAEVLT